MGLHVTSLFILRNLILKTSTNRTSRKLKGLKEIKFNQKMVEKMTSQFNRTKWLRFARNNISNSRSRELAVRDTFYLKSYLSGSFSCTEYNPSTILTTKCMHTPETESQNVRITRSYVHTPEPSQEWDLNFALPWDQSFRCHSLLQQNTRTICNISSRSHE